MEIYIQIIHVFTSNSWYPGGRMSLFLSVTGGFFVNAVWEKKASAGIFLCATAAVGGACCKGHPCSEVWLRFDFAL